MSLQGLAKAICVGVGLKSEPLAEVKENLLELIDLVQANDGEVVATLTQMLPAWNPTYLIGSGKVQELKDLVIQTGANQVVFDHQLSGGQTRNLEKELGVSVLDRSQVILSIFAKRAKTYEGKLQVELAQMMDQLPRMVGAWMDSLSRQGGGIGTRGPGETALENDKRRIRERIQQIRKKLEVVRQNREQNRQNRKKKDVVAFALVGYTNSGKSSLLQRLTGKETYIKNQPFATLDPTTRRIFLGTAREAVVTDTVGFIRKIPPQLIEAFKATLEESEESDVLLHVVDLSNPSMDKNIQVVEEIVEELGWNNKLMIYVYNKVDQASVTQRFKAGGSPRVFVSALTGEGIEELKSLMREFVDQQWFVGEYLFPMSTLESYFQFVGQAQVLEQKTLPQGYWVRAKLSQSMAPIWNSFAFHADNR
ncbi:MAG: GTPase HflX [Bdellovibrionaceae bacterium]|nr:GTPase HflX [Pseudobdellovibrionaceae bacterium]